MKKHVNHRPKQKALTLALTAALAVMAQTAIAQQVTISSPTTGPYTWSSGNLSVTSTISGGSSGVAVNNSVGTLINSGSISGSSGGVVNNGGTIGTLSNSGTISGSYGIFNTGSIGMLSNSGTISGGRQGIYNNGGSITSLDNTIGGIISGSNTGIYNSGTIGTLSNSGTIGNNNSTTYGIYNDTSGTITTLENRAGGTIAGYTTAIYNNGTIGSLTNNGAIVGWTHAIYNAGSIGTLSNSGTISEYNNYGIGIGNGSTIDSLSNSGSITGETGIENDASATISTLTNSGTISGGNTGIYNSGTIGTLTNSGTISGSSASGLGSFSGYGIYTGGVITLLNNTIGGAISGGNYGIDNFGAIGALTNSGVISGGYSGIENYDGTIGTLTNSGTISGLWDGGIYNDSGAIATLTNSGVISGNDYGIENYNGTIGTLTNSGTISGHGGEGIYNESGTIATLTNSGVISGGDTGIENYNGTIGTLTNSGTISGVWDEGIYNGGTISSLTNSGTISGGYSGIYNGGTISSLTNSGTISGGYSGIYNYGTIGTLTNSGTISGNDYGIANYGTISALTNSGVISSVAEEGIYNGNGGTIDTLTNSGVISGGIYYAGIYNNGTIGTLINSGTITDANYAIYNDTSGSLGPIINSGVIAGNIANLSSQDLSISGGTGTIFGTLTGSGGSTVGTITNTSSNVTFDSGNLLLNDNINLGTGTLNVVNNTGTAVLQVNQPITITGNYNQGSSATLQIGVASGATTQGTISTDTGYGRLVVTGNSTIASGSSVTLQSNGYAFAAGQRYVVVDTAGTAVYNQGSLNYSINGYTSTVTGTVVANGSNSDLVLEVVSATPNSGSTSTTGSGSASVATAPNAIASLKGLLGYTGISSSALLNLYDAALGSLSDGSAATANRIGRQLGATQTGWASAAPTFDALNVVGAHVNSLRLAQAAGETGVASGEGPAQLGVWGQAYGGHASQNERDQVDGYSANYAGLLLGVDRAINERWRAGGAFSYSNTAINNTGDTAGDKTRVNGYSLIGYASYTGSPWYVNLSGAVVQQQFDTTRVVSFEGFSGAATGHFSGQQYVARAEAGYPLALGSATLTPLASLTYSYQYQGSYTESGGNGAALSVDSSHASSVKSSLGGRLEKGFSTSYGEIVPEVQAQWIHEYNHTRQVTGAGFAADPTGQTAFTTVGAAPVSDLADISLGVTLLRANNLSLSVRYELQAAPGFVSQTGTVRLRQLF